MSPNGFGWFHLVSSGFIWYFSPFFLQCQCLATEWQDLERFPCEELQREDGLRSPGGAELTLLDVPGGGKTSWRFLAFRGWTEKLCCLESRLSYWRVWRLRLSMLTSFDRNQHVQHDTCRYMSCWSGRRCLPQAVQAAAEADIALLVVSAKGRELEAALREASGTSALAEQLRVAKGLGARRPEWNSSCGR